MTESNVLEAAPQNSTAAATQSTTHSETSHSETSHPELTLGSGAPAQETSEPKSAPTLRGRIDKFGTSMGTGRRKTSVARVRIRPGNGKISINSRTLEDYFRFERNRALIEGPLNATDTLGKYDVWV